MSGGSRPYTKGPVKPTAPPERVLPGRLTSYLRLQNASKRLALEVNHALAAVGIEESAFLTLSLLDTACAGASTPAVMAALSGQSRTNLTHICDWLLQQGFITRRQAEADRRRVEVRITEKGRQRLPELTRAFEAALTQVVRSLSEEEACRVEMLLACCDHDQ